MSQIRKNHHHVLIIGSHRTEVELRPALNRHGYVVEYCPNHLEGTRRFRSRKQAIVILDIESIRGLPERLFWFFKMVRENVLILIAVNVRDRALATPYLLKGAHDVIYFPLERDALAATMDRVSEYHQAVTRGAFVKDAAFFALLMTPIWVGLIFLALR